MNHRIEQGYFFAPEAAGDREPVALAVCERPRVRARQHGCGALSDAELLTLQLQGAGDDPGEAHCLAMRLVGRFGSLAGLMGRTAGDLSAEGCTDAQAWRLAAFCEASRRVLSAGGEVAPLLAMPDRVAAFMAPTVAGLDVEKFWVLCLNRKNRLIRRVEITSGTATSALAHPREVFRAAIRESATGIICVHNHPSGDPAPSAPDMHVTRVLREASKAIDIELTDHVICGRAGSDPTGRGYFSFREAGMI